MLQPHLYFRSMLTLHTLFRTEEHNNVRTGGTTIRRLSTPLGGGPSVEASTAGLCGLDFRQQPFLRH
jgi:hypothetical protein